MTLSINVGAVHGNAANNRERENESPHVSRKSPRLSTSSSPSSHRGGPLSDVHSKISNSPRREESSKSSSSSTPSKPKPPTPARSSALPPTYNNNRFNSTANKFKPRGPSKDDIEATDDKQASVNQLSHWLSESAKKNRKPPIHHRQTAGGGSSHHITTPIRFATKPRINKADVEATDDKRVSVKTLSSWMSDDPFQQKKVRTIRSGSKVIAKSRIFEKDQNVKMDCNIKTGSVGERQAWLSEAFSHESADVVQPQMLSEKKARCTFQAKKKTTSPEMELKSVSEKKEWLSKAFKNSADGDSPAIVHQTKSFDVNQEDDEIPDIHHTKSFEVHDVYPTKSFEASLKDARKSIMTPWVNQAKSFEGVHNVYPTKSFEAQIQDTKESIMKPSVDDGKGTMSHHPIKHTKSYDGGMKSNKSHATNTFEKQQSVVRLYQMDKDDTESPEKALKSVHDKQAWLSNAFKKPAGANNVNGHAASSPVVKDAKKSKSNDVEHVHLNVGEVSTVNVGKSIIDDEKSAPKTKINDNSSDKPDIDSMTVAERARWLKGAFK